MQPLHMQVIEQALQECERLIIILGSSNKEQTLRNPFSISHLERYLTKPVLENLEEIREYYLKIIENPKEDFSII